MSLSFNGSTSGLVSTGHALTTTNSVSILCWIKMTGYGEGGEGIILGRDEGNNAFRLFSASSVSGVKFRNITNDTPGEWNYALSLSTWYCVAVSFDRTNSPTPDPNFYIREIGVDSELINVSETENQTPIGASETPLSGYGHGANFSSTKTFNGLLARLQVWNAVVTEANLETASTAPGTYTTNIQLYIDDTMEDQSGNNYDPTVTDVSVNAEDPITFPGGAAAGKAFRKALLGVGV